MCIQQRTSIVWFALLLVPVLASTGCQIAKPVEPLRVLMVTGGVHHDYDTLPPKLADRLKARGGMTVDITQNLADLSHPTVDHYDLLLFNTCQQTELEPSIRQGIVDHLQAGRGLVVMHCSLWSFQSWPEWTQMVGGFAPGHAKYGPFEVEVLDPDHSAVLGLGEGFQITDEPYYVDKRDSGAQVLIRTKQQYEGRQGPEPQVWTRQVGPGRVFSVTFGHDAASQDSEEFLRLLHNGILWAARRVPDTAHNTLTRAEESVGFRLLFNGRDLDGWSGPPGQWSVENGELVGRCQEIPHNQFLIYEREEFGDFELHVDVKLIHWNSGIQFRSRRYDDFVVKGYQADVAKGWYGTLVEEGGPRSVLADGWKDKGGKVARLDGWNTYIIRAQGPRITMRLNGVQTVDFVETEERPRSGVIALQLHTGSAMEVRYRDIKILPLK